MHIVERVVSPLGRRLSGRTELEKGAWKCQELLWPRVLGSISWGAEEMS